MRKAAILSALIMGSGCFSEPAQSPDLSVDDETNCQPGRQVDCVCPDGMTGTQTCDSEGFGFGVQTSDDEGSSTGEEDDESSGDESSDSGDVPSDTNPGSDTMEDMTTGGMETCDMVDFLFVVGDAPSSVAIDSQERLAAAVPGMIASLSADFPSLDYHVAVVGTDTPDLNPTPPDNCNEVGAMLTDHAGAPESCGPFDSGAHFMNNSDDLAAGMECLSNMGESGQVEKPMDSLRFSLGTPLASAGGCNDGFMRENALLVVVVLSAYYDGPGHPLGSTFGSSGTPQEWHQDVLAAKDGDAGRVVTLSLVYDEASGCSAPFDSMHEFANPVNIVDFTNQFDNGMVGGICNDTYTPFFTSALPMIEEVCTAM